MSTGPRPSTPDKAGFALDVDYHPSPGFRVVQLTPPGSACSIQFGIGLTGAAPGIVRHGVSGRHRHRSRPSRADRARCARRRDPAQGPVATWAGGFAPGVDPQRRGYASFAEFADEDGNTWVLQEIGHPQHA